MPLPKELPGQEELLRIFDYNPKTGLLKWRARPEATPQWNGKHAWHIAGNVSKSNGRIVVNVGGRLLLVHRIIWKIVHGTDPDCDIDHIDGDPTNNRIGNLRLATKHENLRNARPHAKKKLPKGVSFHHGAGRYRATIFINNRHKHLGLFDDPKSAHQAYRKAAMEAFGGFARFE